MQTHTVAYYANTHVHFMGNLKLHIGIQLEVSYHIANGMVNTCKIDTQRMRIGSHYCQQTKAKG